jgi:hypothetical protein
MNRIVILIFSAFIIIGCKKPKPEFALKKFEYSAGDIIEYENHSENQKNCLWEIFNQNGDSISAFIGNYPTIKLGLLLSDGIYSIQLSAHKKNENRKQVSEKKSFFVKTIRSGLTINPNGASSSQQKNYAVYVDGEFIGEGKYSFSNSQSGRFYSELPVGIRHVKLIAPNKVKEETIIISSSVNNVNIYF